MASSVDLQFLSRIEDGFVGGAVMYIEDGFFGGPVMFIEDRGWIL